MNGEYLTSKSYAMHYVFTWVWSENLQESDTDVRNRTQKWSRWGILLFLFIPFLFVLVEMCVIRCFHATDLVFVKHFVMLKWLDQYEKGIQCKIARVLGTSSRALFCKCLIWNYKISSLCSRKSRLVECTDNWYGSPCNIRVNVSFTYIFFCSNSLILWQ